MFLSRINPREQVEGHKGVPCTAFDRVRVTAALNAPFKFNADMSSVSQSQAGEFERQKSEGIPKRAHNLKYYFCRAPAAAGQTALINQ
jgi:hypothetical protein